MQILAFVVGFVSLFSGFARATCPADTGIMIAKQLTRDFIAAFNAQNMALIHGMSTDNATASYRLQIGGSCRYGSNVSLFEATPLAFSAGIHINSFNIDEAFLTAVGYTVTMVTAQCNQNGQEFESTMQFSYYPPNGDCNLQLLFTVWNDIRCPAT